MGLFELFFESFNPGPVGEMKYNRKKPKLPNDLVILARLILSSGIIWVLFKGFFGGMSRIPLNLSTVLVYSGGILAYCLVGYLLIPKPDWSNVGWLGGLFDNPFRFSDDLNRFLVFLLIVLYPGRFIFETLIQVYLRFKELKE